MKLEHVPLSHTALIKGIKLNIVSQHRFVVGLHA